MFKMFYLTLTHAGYLQILFLAGAINRPICQWTEIDGGFVNNTEMTPCHSLIQGNIVCPEIQLQFSQSC